MDDDERGVRTYVVVRQYRSADDDRRRPMEAYISTQHPRRIMALDDVVAFFECDKFSAHESIREIPTVALVEEIARRLKVEVDTNG